eukprot:6189935-Pleurochrysis_carterae.AAC.4
MACENVRSQMQRGAATLLILLNLPANFASSRLQLTHFSFILENKTKATDRLRTGLSTAKTTGPVLSADLPFLHRLGNERGYERKSLNMIRTSRT